MSEQRFNTPGPIRLDIKIPAGDVDVETVDGAESTVVLEGSQRRIDETKVELVGDRLLIQPERKGFGLFGRFDGSLHVRAHVPHGSRVELVSAAGDARLEGSFGGLETKSASGDLRVTGELGGDVKVKSVSGEVRLPHVAGDLTVQTVSGDINADAIDGSVTANSVSGDVRVGSLREGKVSVQSVSGDVELGIAPGTSIEVDASSASGQLSSEIALSGASGGEGGPAIVIRGKTVSGAFRILRAA
jgi:hypothetical protein